MVNLRAAVIGCGRMGAEPSVRLEGISPHGWLPISHAECLASTPGVSLVALCDSDTARLERHGHFYGISGLHTDYRELLEKSRPDILSIATRTPGKVDIIRAACAQGVRGIYVEKPLANSLEEATAAVEAAARSGTVLVYGVNRRHHPIYRRARQLLGEGAIGAVVEVSAEFGRAPLLWAHPHSVDLMLFMLGRAPVAVEARMKNDTVTLTHESLVDSDPVIEHAVFTYADGARGTITRTPGCTLRVGGTRGTLTVHADGDSLQLSLPRGESAYFTEHDFERAAPSRSATQTAFAEMLATLRGEGPPPITPDEIVAGLRMLFGAVTSHLQDGARVTLSEVRADLRVTGQFNGLYA